MTRLAVFVVALLVAVGQQAFAQHRDPLGGAWEVVWGRYGPPGKPVEMTSSDAPIQLKLFTSNRFAYVRHGDNGAFQAASAGTYVVEGDRYTETTGWSSVPGAIGTRVTFRWRLVGDALCMSGPVEVIDSQGRRLERVAPTKELMRRAGTKVTDRTACQ